LILRNRVTARRAGDLWAPYCSHGVRGKNVLEPRPGTHGCVSSRALARRPPAGGDVGRCSRPVPADPRGGVRDRGRQSVSGPRGQAARPPVRVLPSGRVFMHSLPFALLIALGCSRTGGTPIDHASPARSWARICYIWLATRTGVYLLGRFRPNCCGHVLQRSRAPAGLLGQASTGQCAALDRLFGDRARGDNSRGDAGYPEKNMKRPCVTLITHRGFCGKGACEVSPQMNMLFHLGINHGGVRITRLPLASRGRGPRRDCGSHGGRPRDWTATAPSRGRRAFRSTGASWARRPSTRGRRRCRRTRGRRPVRRSRCRR